MSSAAAVFFAGFVFLILALLNRLIMGIGSQWGVPFPFLDRISFGFVFIGLGIPAFLGLRRLLKARSDYLIPPNFLRDHRTLRWAGIGGLAGIGMFACVRVYLEIQKRAYGLPDGSSIVKAQLDGSFLDLFFLFVLTGLLTPILEEIFYRQLVLGFLRDTNVPTAGALLFQAALFALAHTGPAIPVMLFVGLAFGILFWRQSLASAIVAHIVYNSAILVEAWWTGN